MKSIGAKNGLITGIKWQNRQSGIDADVSKRWKTAVPVQS